MKPQNVPLCVFDHPVFRLISVCLFFSMLLYACKGKSANYGTRADNGTAIAAASDSACMPDTPGVHGRALSLRVLDSMLTALKPGDPYPADIAGFAGMTRLMGFVADSANGDLLLYGQADPALPGMKFEDLQLSLLNIADRFAEKRGDTVSYNYPGCSIDMDGGTLAKLDKVQARFSNNRNVDSVYSDWYNTCNAPQNVRVLGIPFDTHMAAVMVKADYDMKTVVDGKDSLPIPGFKSLTDRQMDIAAAQMARDPAHVSEGNFLNRFWFYPGRVLLGRSSSMIGFCDCSVRLLTEKQYLNRSGGISGTGKADSLAEQFASDFTTHFREIASLRGEYYELENVFRLFAIARALSAADLPAYAKVLVMNIANHTRYLGQGLKHQVPGRANVKWFQYSRTQADRYEVYRLYMPSCGGVGLNIELGRGNFRPDSNGMLARLQQRLSKARPGKTSLIWNF